MFAAFTGQGGQEAFYREPGWIVESECDLRVGGVWTVTFGPSRDELYRHEHVFRVIDRPRRILLDATESRADGSIVEYETELIFEERDGRTLMTRSSVASRPPSFATSTGPACRAHSRASSG